MSLQPDHRHHVRQVQLPSGKTIEVVYFEGHSVEPETRVGGRDVDHDLHVCGSCDATLVYPIDWEEEGAAHWRVTLRCPNCLWSGSGVFEQAAVERFDEELDRGTEIMVRDLKRLMAANMEDEIDRFVHALRDDHILPSDF